MTDRKAAQYQRNLSHSYMILPGTEPEGADFVCRMMEDNRIPGLLRFHQMPADDAIHFYYEITSRQPLKHILEVRRLRAEDIRGIVGDILSTVSRLEDYLLPEDALLWDTAYIYVEPDSMAVELCLLPGSCTPMAEGMSALLRQILEKTDPQDPEAVVLACSLYETSRKDNYSSEDLRKCLSGQHLPSFRKAVQERTLQDGALQDRTGSEMGAGEQRTVMRETEEGWEVDEEVQRSAVFVPDADLDLPMPAGRAWAGFLRGFLGIVLPVLAGELILWFWQGMAGWRRNWPIALLLGMAAGTLQMAVKGSLSVVARSRGERNKDTETQEKGTAKAGNVIMKTADRREGGRAEENADCDAGPERSKVKEITSWQIYPESREEQEREEERQRLLRIEQAAMEGTVCLSHTETEAHGMGDEENSAAALIPVGEDSGQQKIEIAYTPFIIGKHRELADYCLDMPVVSRMHAKIDRENGVYSITDLNAMNGTYVNGRKLAVYETAPLHDEDMIKLADVSWHFVERAKQTGMNDENAL